MAITYTTLENLKTYLDVTTEDKDEYLQDLIDVGTDMLDIELGDNLGEQTITRKLDGTGCYRIVMENKINSVTSLQYSSDEGQTWYDIDVLEIDNMVVHAKSEIPKGYKNIKITYTKGYAIVPQDMERFFLMYVSKLKQLSDESVISGYDKVKEVKIGELSKKMYSPAEIAERDQIFEKKLEKIVAKYGNFRLTVC